MNLKVLKSSVLTGTDEAKSNFVSTLKGRCVKPTDETVMVNGVEEKLFFNSENKTYFDRCMTIYRKCPGCGNIKPASDFVECPILYEQRYVHEGESMYRSEEFVCRDCLEEGNFIVPCKEKANINAPIADNGFYLYRNPDESVKPVYKTVEVEYRDDNGNIAHGFTYRACFDFRTLLKWNYETDKFDKYTHGLFGRKDVIVVRYRGIFGITNSDYLLREEVEAHPEIWKKCPRCGEWFHHSMIAESGMCKKCDAEVQIPLYNSWTGKTVFMSSDSEIVNDHTLFFGLEIPIWGYASDVREYLLDPIADICHFERVSENIENEDFYIVSQPMTLNYLKENIGRIEEVLDTHYEYEEIRPGYGDFIIDTPVAAYKDKESLRRACGIVLGLSDAIKKVFCFSDIYCPSIGTAPSTKGLDEVIDLLSTELPLAPINFDKKHPDQIKYRLFDETMNPIEIMAYVEFVNNIVEMANSDKAVVAFSDLLHGEYISQYVEDRKRFVNVDRLLNNAVHFGTDESESNE